MREINGLEMSVLSTFSFSVLWGSEGKSPRLLLWSHWAVPRLVYLWRQRLKEAGPGASVVEAHSYTVRLNMSWDVVSSLMSKGVGCSIK